MDEKGIRLLIRRMLHSGQLPYDGASNVGGSPAAGEVCAACGFVITAEQFVMEGVTKRGNGTRPSNSMFSASRCGTRRGASLAR